MMLTCSECGKPVQKPYRKFCSVQCKAAKKAAGERRRKEANPEKERESVNARVHRYKKAHPEKVKEYQRSYYKANSDRLKEHRRSCYEANSESEKEYQRCRRQSDPEKVKESIARWRRDNPSWTKDKWLADIQFRLSMQLRSRLRHAMKRDFKAGSAVRDLGCSIAELKLHLERQFDENMTWENWGPYWHIDHVKPLASFDLTDRVQFLQAVHWSNLQPLEKIENLRKGKRILEQAQELALAA